MALFDSKQIREEKKIYKLLLYIKDTSKQLKIYLPKTEEEFLKYEYKEEYIYAYKYSCNLMKNTQLVQLLNLKNVGECFDLIIEFVLKHRRFNLNNFTIENYIEIELNALKIQAESNQQHQKSIENTKKMDDNISKKLYQLNSKSNSSIQSQYAKEGAKETINEIKLHEFNEKFPEYKKISAIIIFKKAKLELNNDENKIIDYILKFGKSKDSNFSLEDLLIPFIEEKQAMGLQVDKRENEILRRALHTNFMNFSESQIIEHARKSLMYISLNWQFNTNIDFEDYMKKFEHFMQNYYSVLVEYINNKNTKGR